MTDAALEEVLRAEGARFEQIDGISMVADFGDPAGEYQAVRHAAGIIAQQLRGTIELTGGDRVNWLNNLVTNAVKPLQAGQGLYTFAVNLKGRIVFDANVLVRRDVIWLDIDRRWISAARAHLDRYLITEDVKLTDRSDAFEKIALIGPAAAQVIAATITTESRHDTSDSAADLDKMPELSSREITLPGSQFLLGRHNLAGAPGFELFVPAAKAATCWRRIREVGTGFGARAVGRTALESLRIEAGIPAPVSDLNEEVLPAETGRFDHAVSITKGCYLGQEVVERMRSRGAMARQLVGLEFSQPVQPPVPLLRSGAAVGIVTSACMSLGLGRPIGLGYIKTTDAPEGTELSLEVTAEGTARVCTLPFCTGPC